MAEGARPVLPLLPLLLLLHLGRGVQLGPQESSVLLRQGAITGMRVLTETRQGVHAYLGVPYAEPPVGELRFSAPARHRGWNGTLAATSFRPACPQPDSSSAGSAAAAASASGYAPGGGLGRGLSASDGAGRLEQDEDCLFLNIWAPEGATPFRPLPVVLVLEGRGFVTGTPTALPAQDLAAEGVVVVTVAYRLNVFGFLCLGDGGARGNLGLLDQYLALLWVRDNIEAFGGDPRTVTLMGHGAGAASVAMHLTSPRTLGLFQRAILMSGSASSPWSRSPSATAASLGVARSLGCPLPLLASYPVPLPPLPPLRPPSAPTLDCLRSKSTAEILRAFLTQYQAGNWSELTLPVSDSFLPPEEQYLPRDATEALRQGAFHQVPVVAGVADQDGTVALSEQRDLARQSFSQLRRFFADAAIPAAAKRYGFTQMPTRWPPDDVNSVEGAADDDRPHRHQADPGIEVPVDATIRALLEWKYVSSAPQGDTSALLAGLLQMYTDAQFKAPHARQLQLLAARTSQLFAYRFDQPGPDLVGSGYPGAGYGSELVLLLGPTMTRQLAGRRFTPQEERLAAYLKRMWVDFARTGNPTPGTRGYGVTWPRYSEADQAFLSLVAGGTQPQPLPARSYSFALPSEDADAAQGRGRSGAAAGGRDARDARAAALWNGFLPRLHNDSISRRVASWAASREAPLTTAQPFRSAMFTLLALVLLLLLLLVLCLVLLKRRAKERGRDRDSF